MRTKFFFLALLLTLLAPCSLAAQQNKKVLVAYYSLRNGNTRVIAEEIRKNVGGDLFRIETVQTYPSEYRAVTDQAKKELNSGAHPKLKRGVPNISQYDVIYLGSPNWWGTIAPAVFTFLDTHNLAGKTVIPFITHEGSGLGNAPTDIKKGSPRAKMLQGLAVRGGSVNNAGGDVKAWLKRIGQTK